MACLKEKVVKEWISDDDWTWLEYNLGGLNICVQAQASPQRLGTNIVERHSCSACTIDQTRVRSLRNYSEAFITGITGSTLKRTM